jgi:ribosomal protein L37AE/L43A
MSIHDCPYCKTEINERQYVKAWFFKVVEVCSHCGEMIARSKIDRAIKLGRKNMWLQYGLVVGLFLYAAYLFV